MDNQPSLRSPYLSKSWIDGLFILSPPFVCLLLVMVFPGLFPNNDEMPVWAWVVLVMSIDVAHVYSTLYRTYLAPDSRQKMGALLWVLPLVGFAGSVLLYSLDAMYFWRALAYLAVYHFVKQQYGFLRLYSRYEAKDTLLSRLEKVLIYAACLYPVLHWHLGAPRHFHWFMEGDFRYFSFPVVLPFLGAVYAGLWAVYLCVLLRDFWVRKVFNLPKFLLLAGTALSWYLGIVVYNGDLAFTMFNVVTHGIPYMALVWIYNRRKYGIPKGEKPLLQRIFSWKTLPVFAALLLVFAYAEEWLWDRLVWQEHGAVFGNLHLPKEVLSPEMLALLVPLLSLPQVTHYLLDGYIWKGKYLEVRL